VIHKRKRGNTALKPALALTLLISASLLGPNFLRKSPFEVNFTHVSEGPSEQHWLGTDELGRDILSRILQGGRTSLLIAATVQVSSTFLGVLVGLVAGYARGTVDTMLMALVDSLYSFPALVIVIVMVAVMPPGIESIIIALALVSWPLPARVMRTKVVSLRKEEFVVAAKALGASDARILFRHILPNSISPIIALFTQGAATTIISESALGYLGLGLPASYPTWGGMIAKGRDYLLGSPHIALFPTLALMIAVISFNRLGEALRVYLDPRRAA